MPLVSETKYLIVQIANLLLLFLDGVDKHGRELVVFDAFDLAFFVSEGQQRLDALDFFGTKADVAPAAIFPGEGDWAEAIDYVESAEE